MSTMRNVRNLPASVGTIFGKLTVIGEHVTGPDGNYLPCQCECGVPVFVRWNVLNAGNRVDCGNCKIKRKTERLYNIWGGMRERCNNARGQRYADYGGRGITVCPEWNDYMVFREWALANGYADDLTLERKDVNGNYEPDNCCWIPKADQSRNRRSNLVFMYDGESKILKDWSDDPRCAVSYHTLYGRITRDGWKFDDALVAPRGSRKPRASD